jgi:hypothetical protein
MLPSLCLHSLKARLQCVHSVSINLAQHISLELQIDAGCIVPVTIGDHDAVWRWALSATAQELHESIEQPAR